MLKPITDLSKCCIHTITTKPWAFEQALEAFSAKGVGGISIWQQAVEEMGIETAAKLLEQYPIEVVSYVRGGFFPNVDATKRQQSIEDNKQMLEEAAVLGAPLLVLVCGAEPQLTLGQSRKQIQAGIEALIPHASRLGVKLGIEPLHPMYADIRSAINSMGQANAIAEAINSEWVGVVVDVYHLWWDDALEMEIKRCGKNGHLLAYHVCDWKVPTNHMLTDRGIMGEGCIKLKEIRKWVEEAGFDGFIEVEIFSDEYWAMDQHAYLDKIIHGYLNHV